MSTSILQVTGQSQTHPKICGRAYVGGGGGVLSCPFCLALSRHVNVWLIWFTNLLIISLCYLVSVPGSQDLSEKLFSLLHFVSQIGTHHFFKCILFFFKKSFFENHCMLIFLRFFAHAVHKLGNRRLGSPSITVQHEKSTFSDLLA